MKKPTSLFFTAVHLLLIRENKVLLLRRYKTGIYDGYWCLPSGKIEENESPLQAIIRESEEEVGVQGVPSFMTAVAGRWPHYLNINEFSRDINLFFALTSYNGDVHNREPHKHDVMEWFDMAALPESLIPVVKIGIDQVLKGIPYGEWGYDHKDILA